MTAEIQEEGLSNLRVWKKIFSYFVETLKLLYHEEGRYLSIPVLRG